MPVSLKTGTNSGVRAPAHSAPGIREIVHQKTTVSNIHPDSEKSKCGVTNADQKLRVWRDAPLSWRRSRVEKLIVEHTA